MQRRGIPFDSRLTRPGPAAVLTGALGIMGVLAMSGPAAGQPAAEPPYACREDRAGVVQCIAGKLCACRFERGGALSASPTSGWRWDCGILRPSCGPESELPATLRGDGTIAPEDAIPESIILDLRGRADDPVPAPDDADDPGEGGGKDGGEPGSEGGGEDDGGDAGDGDPGDGDPGDGEAGDGAPDDGGDAGSGDGSDAGDGGGSDDDA